MTKIIAEQVHTYGPRPIADFGPDATIIATVRFDDRCGNGHNTFAITADVTSRRGAETGGALHVEIAAAFPELEPLIKWHLCSTTGPLHYIENTMYWLGRRGYTRWDNERRGRPTSDTDPPNFEYAKRSAIWPDMPTSYLITDTVVSNAEIEAVLAERLPALLASFRAAIESVGLSW